jgi:hypothetical protein
MPILTSRSRIVAYKNCPYLGYLSYDWSPAGGLEPVSAALPLATGIALHEAVARILNKEDPEVVIHQEVSAFRGELSSRGGVLNEGEVDLSFLIDEQATLLEGTLRAWLTIRLPRLLAEYDLIAVERELNWPIAEDIIDQVRCDLLARRKADGLLFYVEWKSTSTGGDEWAKQWEHNTQLLANTLAVEEMLGERLDGVMIEGIVKGRRKRDDNPRSPFYGRRIHNSPLTYGYECALTGDVQSKYTAAKGWEKVASWQVRSSPAVWIRDAVSTEELEKLFAPVPPIRPREEHLRRWREQTIAEERDRAHRLQLVRTGDLPAHVAFPLNDEHCFRYWGHPCAFEPLCFTGAIAADPIGSGLYQLKKNHHSQWHPEEEPHI